MSYSNLTKENFDISIKFDWEGLDTSEEIKNLNKMDWDKYFDL